MLTRQHSKSFITTSLLATSTGPAYRSHLGRSNINFVNTDIIGKEQHIYELLDYSTVILRIVEYIHRV